MKNIILKRLNAILIITFYGLSFLSTLRCNRETTKIENYAYCEKYDKDVKLKRVYFDLMNGNFIHYLILEPYSETCYEFLDFQKLTLHYIDTCSANNIKPIQRVTFMKYCDEDFNPSEPDFKLLRKEELVTFGIDLSANKPKISHIGIYREGKCLYIKLDDCNVP